MKNAPPGYECPFCGIAEALPSPAPESAVVLVDANVFALVPTHHYAGIKGNCLVVPRSHYENVLDIPDDLGSDFFRVTRRLAHAMRNAFGCEGISTERGQVRLSMVRCDAAGQSRVGGEAGGHRFTPAPSAAISSTVSTISAIASQRSPAELQASDTPWQK